MGPPILADWPMESHAGLENSFPAFFGAFVGVFSCVQVRMGGSVDWGLLVGGGCARVTAGLQ